MFQIADVVAGWFAIKVGSGETGFEIDCAKCTDIDVGEQFLDIANGLSKYLPIQRYMCLNSVQYAYRMECRQENGMLQVQICEIYSGADASATAFRFFNATPSALDFATVRPPVFIGEYDAFAFAVSIYKAFRDLDKEQYSKNSFPFPQEKYDRLNQYMKYRMPNCESTAD